VHIELTEGVKAGVLIGKPGVELIYIRPQPIASDKLMSGTEGTADASMVVIEITPPDVTPLF